MKSKIALATIHVSLSTKSTAAWRTPGKSLTRAAKTGVEGAGALAVYAGMAFVTVAPTLLPLALLLTGIVLVARRRLRSRGLPVATT